MKLKPSTLWAIEHLYEQAQIAAGFGRRGGPFSSLRADIRDQWWAIGFVLELAGIDMDAVRQAFVYPEPLFDVEEIQRRMRAIRTYVGDCLYIMGRREL